MTLPLVSILDDEPEIRQILVDALEDAGFRTEVSPAPRSSKPACASQYLTSAWLI